MTDIDNNTAQTFHGIPVQVWQDAYRYDPDTGAIRWREDRPEGHFATAAGYRSWKTRSAGKGATSVNGRGYLQVPLTYQGGKQVTAKAHRLAWLLHHGEVLATGMQIDHVNGDKADNRISNLRLVSHAENGRAFNRPQGGSSVYRGVHWNKQQSRWKASIQHNGTQRVSDTSTMNTPLHWPSTSPQRRWDGLRKRGTSFPQSTSSPRSPTSA